MQSDWEEVYQRWQKEEDNESWQDVYRAKGFIKWSDWRDSIIRVLELDHRDWKIETPENPIKRARRMYCNALVPRWTKLYGEREKSTFADFAHHPELEADPRVLKMRQAFPDNTQIISLRLGEHEIAIDGHHRATTLAGLPINVNYNPHVDFAVTDFSYQEKGLFEKIYHGTLDLKLQRAIYHLIAMGRSQFSNLI